jgi:hypothetical protein
MTAEPVVLTAETFARHVGQTFLIRGGRYALVLTEIETSPLESWQARASFTLLFSGPPGDVLAEGMHALTQEDGTAYELYVMPIHTPVAGRQDYQSVFN